MIENRQQLRIVCRQIVLNNGDTFAVKQLRLVIFAVPMKKPGTVDEQCGKAN